MNGVLVGRCEGCGRRAFPTPAVCHRCGSLAWGSCLLQTGVVEEHARVQHAVGGASGEVILASVRLEGGPHVIVAIPEAVQTGAVVRVSSTVSGIRTEPAE